MCLKNTTSYSKEKKAYSFSISGSLTLMTAVQISNHLIAKMTHMLNRVLNSARKWGLLREKNKLTMIIPVYKLRIILTDTQGLLRNMMCSKFKTIKKSAVLLELNCQPINHHFFQIIRLIINLSHKQLLKQIMQMPEIQTVIR